MLAAQGGEMTKYRAFAFLLTLALSYGAHAFVQHRESIAYEQGIDEMVWSVSTCTLEMAHQEKCFIPCSTDADCMQKNGQEDH